LRTTRSPIAATPTTTGTTQTGIEGAGRGGGRTWPDAVVGWPKMFRMKLAIPAPMSDVVGGSGYEGVVG
jgi:hypothetical protein